MLGLTFKEDVKDIRNSKSAELHNLLIKNKFLVDLYDPLASKVSSKKELNVKIVKPKNKYDCVIITVAHKEFRNFSMETILKLLNKPSLLVDIKNVWSKKKLPDYVKKWSL